MAGLEGTVQVPALGKVPKKEAAIGAAVVGTLVIVYYVRKNKSSSMTAAGAAATSTNQYPADGTVGNPQDLYSTDPATGATYGNELAGSGGTFGSNSGGAPDSGTGQSSAPGTNPGGPPFSSNDQWASWAIQQLQTVNPNVDAGALTDALGLYLEGQPVDTSQQQLIFDARAIAGDPPVAGAGNYPPNVRLNGNKGGSGNVTVPSVVGERLTDARQSLRHAGLKYTSSAGTGTVSAQDPSAGSSVASGSVVALTVASGTGGGSTKVHVPNVTRARAEDARKALRQAGLTYNISDSETGEVTAQRPRAGTSVDKGARVDLTVKQTATRK